MDTEQLELSFTVMRMQGDVATLENNLTYIKTLKAGREGHNRGWMVGWHY